MTELAACRIHLVPSRSRACLKSRSMQDTALDDFVLIADRRMLLVLDNCGICSKRSRSRERSSARP
jgi:hypothetical protein